MTALATEAVEPRTRPIVRRLRPLEPPYDRVCDYDDHDHSHDHSSYGRSYGQSRQQSPELAHLALVRTAPEPTSPLPYDGQRYDGLPHDELPFDEPPAVTTSARRAPDPAFGRDGETAFWGPQPTRTSQLPDPAGFGRTLVHAALEVLAGRRGVSQLQPLTSPAIYTGISRRVAAQQAAERREAMLAIGRRQAGRAAVPTRSGRPGTATPRPPVIRSIHATTPADGVAELTAVVRHGGRIRAVAVRLEGLDGRWRCVQLQIG